MDLVEEELEERRVVLLTSQAYHLDVGDMGPPLHQSDTMITGPQLLGGS